MQGSRSDQPRAMHSHARGQTPSSLLRRAAMLGAPALLMGAWAPLGELRAKPHEEARARAPTIGERVNDFTLPTEAGELSLRGLGGKLIYLDFWASWCAPCRLSFPWMESMNQQYASSGLSILAVCLDQQTQDAASFLRQQRPSFSIAYDPSARVATSFAVQTMPSSFFIEWPSLTLIASHRGFRSSDTKILTELIRRRLS